MSFTAIYKSQPYILFLQIKLKSIRIQINQSAPNNIMPLPPASERGNQGKPYNKVSIEELAERLDGDRPRPFNTASSRVLLVTDLIMPGRDVHIGRPNIGGPGSDFRPYVTYPNHGTQQSQSTRIDRVIIPEDDRREATFVEKKPSDRGETRVTINYQGKITIFDIEIFKR